MNEAALKGEWLDFAKRLHSIGIGIFSGTTLNTTREHPHRRPDLAGSNVEQFEGRRRDGGRRFDR